MHEGPRCQKHFPHVASWRKHTWTIALETVVSMLASTIGVGRKSKHITLRFLYMPELISSGQVMLWKVDTALSLADLFLNKDVSEARTLQLCSRLGLQEAQVSK